MDNKCLFNRGNRCYILKKKECDKCKFFKKDTKENQILYIDNVKKEIKKYAQNHC